jgi:hypothetical protein
MSVHKPSSALRGAQVFNPSSRLDAVLTAGVCKQSTAALANLSLSNSTIINKTHNASLNTGSTPIALVEPLPTAMSGRGKGGKGFGRRSVPPTVVPIGYWQTYLTYEFMNDQVHRADDIFTQIAPQYEVVMEGDYQAHGYFIDDDPRFKAATAALEAVKTEWQNLLSNKAIADNASYVLLDTSIEDKEEFNDRLEAAKDELSRMDDDFNFYTQSGLENAVANIVTGFIKDTKELQSDSDEEQKKADDEDAEYEKQQSEKLKRLRDEEGVQTEDEDDDMKFIEKINKIKEALGIELPGFPDVIAKANELLNLGKDAYGPLDAQANQILISIFGPKRERRV